MIHEGSAAMPQKLMKLKQVTPVPGVKNVGIMAALYDSTGTTQLGLLKLITPKSQSTSKSETRKPKAETRKLEF
jgi:hypothetical protein